MVRFIYEILKLDTKIFKRYGCDYEIKRTASFDSGGNVILQVNSVLLRVVKSSDEETIHEVRVFTKRCTVRDFIRVMSDKMNYDPNEVRLWDYYQKRYHSLLKDKKFLSGCNLMENQLMLIQEKDENGEFPLTKGSSFDNSPTDPGKTGINNIGNTCFMNSGLQCLSSVAPLTDFFVSHEYKKDINEENPLGMKGKVAKAFGGILEKLWSPSTSVVDASDFKSVIEKFSPQFSGHQQHDSHELVAFLLDGLHEDLNRIKRKPYIEEVEMDKPDLELAQIAWDNHLLRNDSVIVDLFQGLLKSRLVCPTCDKVSIKFDPFMYLTLPLPMENKRLLYVTVSFLDHQKGPTRYCVKVEKFGKTKDILEALSELCGIDQDKLILTEIWSCKFQKVFKDDDLTSDISNNDDLFAFEVLGKEETLNLKVILGKRSEKYRNYVSTFGVPFILSVKNNTTPSQLYQAIINKVKILFNGEEIPELAECTEIEDAPMEIDKGSDTEEEDDDDIMQHPKRDEVSTNAIATFCKSDDPPDIFSMPIHEPIPVELDKDKNYWFTFSAKNYKKYYDKTKDESIIEKHESMKTSKADIQQTISIYDCLDMFSAEEILSEDDTWYCNRCKEHKQASKKIDLWRLPSILVIHLKRFSYQSKFSKDKISTLVTFPLNDLNLSNYISGEADINPVYDLIAVSNHFGGMGGGHYTAYASHRNDGKWYQYDDRNVSEVSDIDDICSKAAYLLVYKRKDIVVDPFVYQLPPPEPEVEEPPIVPGLIDE